MGWGTQHWPLLTFSFVRIHPTTDSFIVDFAFMLLLAWRLRLWVVMNYRHWSQSRYTNHTQLIFDTVPCIIAINLNPITEVSAMDCFFKLLLIKVFLIHHDPDIDLLVSMSPAWSLAMNNHLPCLFPQGHPIRFGYLTNLRNPVHLPTLKLL